MNCSLRYTATNATSCCQCCFPANRIPGHIANCTVQAMEIASQEEKIAIFLYLRSSGVKEASLSMYLPWVHVCCRAACHMPRYYYGKSSICGDPKDLQVVASEAACSSSPRFSVIPPPGVLLLASSRQLVIDSSVCPFPDSSPFFPF
jgi:hypothetical protein